MSYRILDANFNRLREALRVIEETERFERERPETAKALKAIRDTVRKAVECLPQAELLAARESDADLGRSSEGEGEMARTDVTGILTANFKRAQEAARVLEEYGKLVSTELPQLAKSIRFSLYSLEKDVLLPL